MTKVTHIAELVVLLSKARATAGKSITDLADATPTVWTNEWKEYDDLFSITAMITREFKDFVGLVKSKEHNAETRRAIVDRFFKKFPPCISTEAQLALKEAKKFESATIPIIGEAITMALSSAVKRHQESGERSRDPLVLSRFHIDRGRGGFHGTASSSSSSRAGTDISSSSRKRERPTGPFIAAVDSTRGGRGGSVPRGGSHVRGGSGGSRPPAKRSRPLQCFICKGEHYVSECPKQDTITSCPFEGTEKGCTRGDKCKWARSHGRG